MVNDDLLSGMWSTPLHGLEVNSNRHLIQYKWPLSCALYLKYISKG